MIKREDIDDNIVISLNKRDENWQIVEDIKNDLAAQKEDYATQANRLIATLTYNSNKEVAPTSLDIATGTFTKVNHGLKNGDSIYPMLDIGEFYYHLPTGLEFKQYFVVNSTTDNFQVSTTSEGNPEIFTTSGNLEKWHFEKIGGSTWFEITNLPPRHRYRAILKFKSHIIQSRIVEVNRVNVPMNFTGYTSTIGYNISQPAGSSSIAIFDYDLSDFPTLIRNVQTVTPKTLTTFEKTIINDVTQGNSSARNILITSLGVYVPLTNGLTLEVYNI